MTYCLIKALMSGERMHLNQWFSNVSWSSSGWCFFLYLWFTTYCRRTHGSNVFV